MKYESTSKTKQIIYDAAYTLFYEKGYNETTIDDINRASNTHKSSFYYFFKSKKDLAFNIYEDAFKHKNYLKNCCENIDYTDDLLIHCIRIFFSWYIYFNDENFRRFFYELSQIHLFDIIGNMEFWEKCRKKSKKAINDNNFILLQAADNGIAGRIHFLAYERVADFNYMQISEFYLRSIFTLFDIDISETEKLLITVKNLMNKIEIKNDKFKIKVKIKSEK